MAIQIQLRQGTTTEHNTFTGAVGELTYDTTLKSLVLHDGVTAGGVKIPYLSNGRVPSTMLPTATESVVGASKIATTAIAQAGTNDTDFITALKLKTVSFGMGQTWQNVTANRVQGTTYTNSTGKIIFIYVANRETSTVTNAVMKININGQQLFFNGGGAGSSGAYKTASAFLPIPHGTTYSVDAFFDFWELR